MMMVLHPTYTVRVRFKDIPAQGLALQAGVNGLGQVVAPKPYKFAGPTTDKTGCDEFMAAIREALQKAGLGNAEITFEKYEQS